MIVYAKGITSISTTTTTAITTVTNTERCRHNWVNNTKRDLTGTECKDIDYTQLTKNGIYVNTAMRIWILNMWVLKLN